MTRRVRLAGFEPATSRLRIDNPRPAARVSDKDRQGHGALSTELQPHVLGNASFRSPVDRRWSFGNDSRLTTGSVAAATPAVGATETASRHSPGSRVRLTLFGATLPPADGGVLVSFRTFTCQTAPRPPVRRRQSFSRSAADGRRFRLLFFIGQAVSPEKEKPHLATAAQVGRSNRSSLGPNRTLTASASFPSHLRSDFGDRTCPAVARLPRSTCDASRYDPR